jgi:hypothetical protein
MSHPDEHIIEMHILRPESLPETVRRETAEHLSSCTSCRAVEESLRSFHADFARPGEADPARVAQLVARAFSSPRIYHLPCYRPRPHTSAGESYTGVLAAMTSDSGTRAGFETVASFASEPDHMLLRVRQDAVKKRVKVYYHADDTARSAGAIVSFPALPAEIVLDDKGQMEFEIPEAMTSREWAALEALVTLPVGTAKMETPPIGESWSEQVGDQSSAHHIVTAKARTDSIALEVTSIGNAPTIRRVVLKDGAGRNILLELSGGYGTVTPLPVGPLVLRLYP